LTPSQQLKTGDNNYVGSIWHPLNVTCLSCDCPTKTWKLRDKTDAGGIIEKGQNS